MAVARLSRHQVRFVAAYLDPAVETNAAAARKAGYKGDENTLKVTASKLLKLPHVFQEIEKRRQEMFDASFFSVEKVLMDLEEARREAMENGKYGAAIKAAELIGKHRKMFTERIEHVETLETMDEADIEAALNEVLGQLHGGVDVKIN